MILRSVIIAVLLLLLYSCVVYSLQERRWFFPVEHQNQHNMMRAEEFIYDGYHTNIVVVGSSMAVRLEMGNPPDEVFILAFDGGSPFMGIEIIEQSGVRPECILVEINTILNDCDERFISHVFNSGLSKVKECYLPMRSSYSPARLVQGILRILSVIYKRHIETNYEGMCHGDIEENNALQQRILALEKSGDNVVPDTEELRFAINKLKSDIKKIRSRGVRVVLFEMPQHENNMNSVYMQKIRSSVLDLCRNEDIRFISVPEHTYETSDFIHLTATSAKKYMKYLYSMVSDNS